MGTIKSVMDKFKEFVGKDTDGQNEPKKITVIVRMLLLSYIVYYVVNIILLNFVYGYSLGMVLCVLFVLICALMLCMTYRGRISLTLWGFISATLMCVISYVHFFCWNTGVQHFLMILLVLYYFSKYRDYAGKIIFTIVITAVRLAMFRVYYTRTPAFVLLSGEIQTLQMINTIMIFWCLSLICFICSESSQKLEGKLLEYNEMLEKQVNEDALTGLYNRRKGREIISAIAENPDMAGNCCISIADIDFFKKVNDTYGHDVGDEVLVTLARLFEKEMRRKDFVARWGGEEFLFVFINSNGDEACQMLEDLRKKVQDTRIRVCGEEIGVTMTFGLTEFLQKEGIDGTLKAADERLYQGKQEGRNRIIY